MQNVLQAVDNICKQRTKEKMAPFAADFYEIARQTGIQHKELKKILRQMVANSELQWYESINSTFFHIHNL